jgi:hypothetical protein
MFQTAQVAFPHVVFAVSPADTNRMLQLFEAVLIAFIALVAFELYLIHRDLSRLLTRAPLPADESAVKGQTINVNVGTPLATDVRPIEGKAAVQAEEVEPPAPPAPEVDEETLAAMEEERAADLRELPPPKPVERSPIGLRATESGLVAKKCEKCGIENSTYRSECFNCGASL